MSFDHLFDSGCITQESMIKHVALCLPYLLHNMVEMYNWGLHSPFVVKTNEVASFIVNSYDLRHIHYSGSFLSRFPRN